MKSKITRIIMVVVLLMAGRVYSQPQPHFQWIKSGGSSGSDMQSGAEEVEKMVTDRNGNVYLLAHIAFDTAYVNGYKGFTNRDRQVLASWDRHGNYRWHKVFGGGGIGSFGLGVDTLGGVYACGLVQHFQNPNPPYSFPPYFDNDTALTTLSYKTQFIIKYDTSGNFQWLKMPEPDTFGATALYYQYFDMDVSPSGNLYIYGNPRPGGYDNGAYTIPQPGYYIVEYDRNGVFQNLVQLDMATDDGKTPPNPGGYGLASLARMRRDHRSGRFYLAGYYDKVYGTLTFGGTSISATGGVGSLPFYITAFNSSGQNLWVRQCSPDNGGGATRIAIGKNSTIYLSDGTGQGNVFNNDTFYNSLATGGSMPLLLALDTNGNTLWSTIGGGTVAIGAAAVAVAGDTVAVTGRYGRTFIWQNDTLTAPFVVPVSPAYIFVARFHAATGQIIGMDSIASSITNRNSATAMAADDRGNFYIGGSFNDQLFTPTDTVTKMPFGDLDWFVSKFCVTDCNCTVPQAAFTYTAGITTTVGFSYTGATSAYTSVHWDFGDGSSATLPNPLHTYSSPGNYTVCVTVTDYCGSDSVCQTVPAGINSMGNTPAFAGISLYPNPARDVLFVEGAAAGTVAELYDATGRRVLYQVLQGSKDRLDVRTLSVGLYLMKLSDKSGQQGMARVVVGY